MTRLKLFITIFFLAVSIPLAFVLWQTYNGISLEEQGQMQFFSDTIFDEMEQELASLIQKEENRDVDEYRHLITTTSNAVKTSVLADINLPSFIIGYMQNNPDNSLQTPHIKNSAVIPNNKQLLYSRLVMANTVFNKRKVSIKQLTQPETKQPPPTQSIAEKSKKTAPSFSQRFVNTRKNPQLTAYLGKKKQRVEKITAQQAYNVAQKDKEESLSTPGSISSLADTDQNDSPISGIEKEQLSENTFDDEYIGSIPRNIDQQKTVLILTGKQENSRTGQPITIEPSPAVPTPTPASNFEVEVAPFQSVSIDTDLAYVFRRIVINNQIYRQGFLIDIKKLLLHLHDTHFKNQPLAQFAELSLHRTDISENQTAIAEKAVFYTQRNFTAPFDFLQGTINTNHLPQSPARKSLNISLSVLICCMLSGLTAIYLSVKAIVNMAEKRSQFVSSVTHELKTPLTNIRMYIEMLEQGIAGNREQEQEYLDIVSKESTRLAGLINNVLDLAKLEKQQHRFHLTTGNFTDVLTEIKAICSQQLKQHGFTLHIQTEENILFQYDREVMIQILFNLIENSMKFGKNSDEKKITISLSRKNNIVILSVADTGPGIPIRSLKKIFQDFYRADNDLTRITGGTGIGLALVKKFITALGGKVSAKNNQDSGCTIVIQLPAKI